MLDSTSEMSETCLLPTILPTAQPIEGLSSDLLGEFEVLAEIGRGSFGRVYLCRQPSLNRLVAVKASQSGRQGSAEGIALAGLEHDHIVKVYSEFTDPVTKWYCLCLQYVPGANLETVIRYLHAKGTPRTGLDFLAALDAVSKGVSDFDPAALRDRDQLAHDDFSQAVCHLGQRLAEALAFAHSKKILHCDVKPANILITPYGRPMLADFNVAFDLTRGQEGGFGGTQAYMAPEHRAALQGEQVALDNRCDIFSLGVVLHELATGTRPQRNFVSDPLDRVPRELAGVIRKCLEREVHHRYPSATALAEALAGARYLIGARRNLPPAGRIVRVVERHPIVALFSASIIPHILASFLNIAYNTANIHLAPEQKDAFESLISRYNIIVYPLCAVILVILIRLLDVRIRELPRLRGAEVDEVRHQTLQFGVRAIALGALGWLPGIVLFPAGIDVLAGSVDRTVYGHFAISLMLSCLVGIVFSYLGIEWVIFRTLLPRLGNPDASPAQSIREEIRPLTALFGPFLVLACVVPLTGAVLLVTLSESALTLEFRVLVVILIGLGALGVGVAERLTRQLARFASIWSVSANAARRFDCMDSSVGNTSFR